MKKELVFLDQQKAFDRVDFWWVYFVLKTSKTFRVYSNVIQKCEPMAFATRGSNDIRFFLGV